jgi:hypothetical protein
MVDIINYVDKLDENSDELRRKKIKIKEELIKEKDFI